jgi:hypothetical protein
VLTDGQATHVLRVLDALDELEAAALKLLTAELACGPVVDGLMADPLTEGSRLDLLCRLLDAAPPSSAREALAQHLARGSV